MLRKCSRSDIFLVPTRSWCRRHLPTSDGMVADRYQSECVNDSCSPCCAAALPSRTISACQHLAQDLNLQEVGVRTLIFRNVRVSREPVILFRDFEQPYVAVRAPAVTDRLSCANNEIAAVTRSIATAK